jgi:chaperone BCS1
MNGKYGDDYNINKSIGEGTHYFFYKGVPIKIIYSMEKSEINRMDKIHITLTKFGRSHALFDELKCELLRMMEEENDTNMIKVYSFNRGNLRWSTDTKIMKRDFNTIFIEDSIKGRLLNHLDNFYAKKEWYHERGIPYQTGICLYGPAGTGKTSIVKGLASYYGKHLCILRSSEIDSLPIALKKLPSDSFVVIEDIDTSSIVLERNPNESLEESLYKTNRGKNSDEGEEYETADSVIGEETIDAAAYDSSPKKMGAPVEDIMSKYSKVLLSDVLNALDGIISIEKRVIIFTTNYVDKLDKALIRPGRIDSIERIDYISFGQFIRFCNLFYKDNVSEEERRQIISKYHDLKHHVTVAELQKNFMQGMKLDDMLKTYCV